MGNSPSNHRRSVFRNMLLAVCLCLFSACKPEPKGDVWDVTLHHAGKDLPVVEVDFSQQDADVESELLALVSQSFTQDGDRLVISQESKKSRKLEKAGVTYDVVESEKHYSEYSLKRDEQGLFTLLVGGHVLAGPTSDLHLLHQIFTEDVIHRNEVSRQMRSANASKK